MAIEKDIPLILAGYSPGQPEPQRMLYEFSPRLIREEDWTPPHLKECGEFSSEELSRFYNPLELPADTCFPRYLAPYHAWEYDQDEVMRKVAELGLVKRGRHASPIVSNYPINWLMMYSDLKHFNYNPYAPEFSALDPRGQGKPELLANHGAPGRLHDPAQGPARPGGEPQPEMAWADR